MTTANSEQRTANSTLSKAKKAKQDEFYTQLGDIENELRYYRAQLEGKVIYCNCDDPYESNFFKYFALNFNFLKLKKLIATSYVKSPIAGNELPLFAMLSPNTTEKQPIVVEINQVMDLNGDGATDLIDVRLLLEQDQNTSRSLKGDSFYAAGDFRSAECVELLKQADIVVTNPPFSLFREYVGQLIEHDKKFVIVGHQNAITYKEIFKLIKDNKLWLGYGFKGGAGHFINEHYEDYATATDRKEGMIRVSGVHWFTNLEINKRHEDLILYKNYTSEEYSNYENFNAINVDKTKDIPINYDGYMGVPITFLDKYNPNQFEIVGLGISNSGLEIGVKPYETAHKRYRKEVQKRGAVDGDLYMMKNGVVDVPYARILIKRKGVAQ